MKRFHVHIYFDPGDLADARLLADRALQTGLFEHVRIHEDPVGPHPKGMIEAHFSEPFYISALNWIKSNRIKFSALVHHDSGDDLKDHTDGVLWLGDELPLNFEFFDLILSRPEFRVHQSEHDHK